MSFGIGEFYSLACALAWAIAVILFKKSGESLPPVALNLFKNVVGLLLMAVTVLAFTGTALPELPAAVVALALFSGFLGIGAGDTLYFRALNAIGASRMGIAQTLYSPFVIVLSSLFLAERLGLWQLLGVALVLAGITLVNYAAPSASAGDKNSSSRTPASRGVLVDARAIRRGVINAAASVFLMALGVVIAKRQCGRQKFFFKDARQPRRSGGRARHPPRRHQRRGVGVPDGAGRGDRQAAAGALRLFMDRESAHCRRYVGPAAACGPAR